MPSTQEPNDSPDTASHPPDDHRLGRLLTWVAGFAIVAAVFEFVMGLTFDSWRLLVGSGIAVFTGLSFLSAARSMHQGNEAAGAVRLTLGIYTGALAYTFALPGAISALALLPVVIVAVLLPFLRGAALLRVLVGSWVAGLALVVFNLLWNSAVQFPEWFVIAFRAIAFATVLALTLSLLLHHHRRLNEAVEQAQNDTRALREAHEQLQESSRVKTRFLNSAAHELRTPLTPVLIQLELMRQNPALKENDRLRHSTQMIERNVMRLKSHVDELLDIARLQSGRFPLKAQDVALGPLLVDVEESFRDLTKKAQITLEVQQPSGIHIQADGPRVVQVLFNLVANAIKATPPGGRIQVTTDVDHDRCTVHVIDTGKGIEEESLHHLFEPFGQIPDDDSSQNGVGLGLYISRSIVEAHGGQIGVTSEGTGKGADFHFTLPLARIEDPVREKRGTIRRRPDKARFSARVANAGPPATQTP